MKTKVIVRTVALAFSLCLAACSTPKPVPGATSTAAGYPAVQGTQPLYPGVAPEPTLRGDEIPFHIAKPIMAGATTVSGTGPAGAPIVLEDVSFMGAVLGQTKVGPDGKFQFAVQPVASGDRLGVTLGDVTGTQFTQDQFYSPGYRGDGSMQVP